MACGDDWPLCNGRLIPAFDLPTLIEWGHRLSAALVGFLVLGLAAYALLPRRAPALAGRGVTGWAGVSAALLIVQVLVGAVTVRLELPPSTVVVHLSVASALLATLLMTGLRAAMPGASAAPETRSSVRYRRGAGPHPSADESATHPRWAMLAAAVGFLVLVFGGLVANTGAGPLCQGFPLCNGDLLPGGGALVHLHWTHRLLAFALVVVVAGGALKAVRQGAPSGVSRAAFTAFGLVLAQIGVAAALVLRHLPDGLRGLHLAVGVALWATLVIWAERASSLTRIGSAAEPVGTAKDSTHGGERRETAGGYVRTR